MGLTLPSPGGSGSPSSPLTFSSNHSRRRWRSSFEEATRTHPTLRQSEEVWACDFDRSAHQLQLTNTSQLHGLATGGAVEWSVSLLQHGRTDAQHDQHQTPNNYSCFHTDREEESMLPSNRLLWRPVDWVWDHRWGREKSQIWGNLLFLHFFF